MTLRKIFFYICLGMLILLLAAGYGTIHQWGGIAAVIVMGLAWLFALKYPASWPPIFCLAASTGLAVTGRLLGAPSWLMIYGSGLALAVWDLLLLNFALESNLPQAQTRTYEKKHLQSLGIVLALGLLVAIPVHSLVLQFPFLLLVFLIALAVFSLDRVLSYIKKSE